MRVQAGVVCLISCAGVSLAGPVGWVAPQYGYWGDVANWDTGMLPSLVDDAVLGHGSLYSVFVAGAHEAGSLSITNPEARLEILEGGSLDLHGDLMTDGLVVVNPKGLDGGSTLRFMTDAMLGGLGELRLIHSDAAGGLVEVADGARLTIGQGMLVSGSGRVSGDLEVLGSVVADRPSEELVLEGGDIDLAGTVIAGFGSSISMEEVEFCMQDGSVLYLVGEGSRLSLSDAEAFDLSVEMGPGSRLSLNGSDIYNLKLDMAEGAELWLPDTGLSGFEDDVSIRESVIEGEFEMMNGEDLSIVDCQLIGAQIVMRVPEDSGGRLSFGNGTEFIGKGLIRFESDDYLSTTLFSFDGMQFDEYEIEGYGRIRGTIENRSEIRNVTPGKVLSIYAKNHYNNPLFDNYGTVRASDGALIRLDGDVLQKDGGEIISEGAGSVIEIFDSIEGGALRGVDGGEFRFREDGELIGVVSDAVIRGIDTSELRLGTRFTNNGHVYADIRSLGDLIIDGDGELTLLGGSSVVGSHTRTEMLTHHAEHTISGHGSLRAHVTNEGLIRANVYQEMLSVTSLVNSGVAQAVGGAFLRTSGNVTQDELGVLRAAGPGSQVILGSASPNVLQYVVGGRLSMTTGGEVHFLNNTSLDEIEISGKLVLQPEAEVILGEDAAFEGVIELYGGDADSENTVLRVEDQYSIGEGVVIRLVSGSEKLVLTQGGSGSFRVVKGGRIEGYGMSASNLVVYGTLAPGFGIGDFETYYRDVTVSGEHGELEIEVGPESHDRLISVYSGDINLWGRLRVEFVDGFEPSGYWAREFAIGSPLSVDLRGLEIGDPPQGLVSRTYVEQGSVWVGQTCLADINLDGQVDFFDTSEFVKWFQRGRYEADLNGDGELDFFDVTAFIVGYQQGCP